MSAIEQITPDRQFPSRLRETHLGPAIAERTDVETVAFRQRGEVKVGLVVGIAPVLQAVPEAHRVSTDCANGVDGRGPGAHKDLTNEQ